MKNFWFLSIVIVSCCSFLSAEQFDYYFIRQAAWEDKKAIIDLYMRSQHYCKNRLQDNYSGVKQIVTACLMAAVDEGFGFVVQSCKQDKIIAFLLLHRPLQKAYRHVLEQTLHAVDPLYHQDVLMIPLYRYVQNQIETYYPDILRIEGYCCPDANSMVAIFQACQFDLEFVRNNAVALPYAKLSSELCFVWKNKNFDQFFSEFS